MRFQKHEDRWVTPNTERVDPAWEVPNPWRGQQMLIRGSLQPVWFSEWREAAAKRGQREGGGQSYTSPLMGSHTCA